MHLFASGHQGFEPVREFDEFELTRMLRAVERIAHHELAQF